MVGCALCLFLGIISVLYFVMTVVIFFICILGRFVTREKHDCLRALRNNSNRIPVPGMKRE